MTRRGLLAVAACLPAAACASKDPARYTLQAVPGGTRTRVSGAVTVRQISIARYLDRQEIVRSSDDYRLQVAGNDWWGETLSSMVGRVLTEDLAQRLPAAQVVAESGAISTDAALRVEVNLQRLDADRSGLVILAAQVAISPKSGEPRTSLYRLSAQPAGPAVADFVAACSIALGQLADAIASALAG